jgi:hypothetical protein
MNIEDVTYESWPMNSKFQFADGACSLMHNSASIILVLRLERCWNWVVATRWQQLTTHNLQDGASTFDNWTFDSSLFKGLEFKL